MAGEARIEAYALRLLGNPGLRETFKQTPHEHFHAAEIQLTPAQSQKLSGLNLPAKTDAELMAMLQPTGTMQRTMF